MLPPDTPADRQGYWIGLYQDHNAPDFSEPAGGWHWITGETVPYTNWHTNEPSNGGNWGREDVACLVVADPYGGWGGTWNDGDDFESYQYGIIEIVPEPSSLLALACGLFALGGMGVRRRRRSP